MHIIIKIKAKEDIDQYIEENEKEDENAAEDYEILLRKEEAEIRQHISIEHQLKIQCEKFAEKLDDLEQQKIRLIDEIVR